MNAAIKITAMPMLVQSSGDAVLAADPMKMGVVNAITGVQAQAGEFTRNGIRFTQEEMNNAGSTQLEDVRSAILAGKGYQGLACTYEFDRNGDGLPGYNFVRYDGGRIVFMKRVDCAVR